MANLKGKNLISITDYTKEEYLQILELASEFEKQPKQPILSDKVVASIFFEPSTRTRLSFESAANMLGARVIGFSNPAATSLQKGESLHDTIQMVSSYSDLIVMRHPRDGAARYASEVASVPVINAGDGAGQHPTQTLLDLYTIKNEIGNIDNLKIALIGDLKFGRTVHSLSHALSLFNNVKIYMVSPPELRMPQEILLDLDKTNVEYEEVDNIEDIIDDVNVLYVTRIQKERFADIDDYYMFAFGF